MASPATISDTAASDAASAANPSVAHFRRPQERGFTRAERDRVTILLGGLTRRHDALIKAGMEGLGYKVALVPVPRKADFQTGREYGNNGQCNPTYFTVGALVNHLKHLRDEEGLSREQIESDYVFVTAGACGPCRFGMYEAEYRLALQNAGFEGFRVLLFQQTGGLDQSDDEAGIEMSLAFFLTLLNAMLLGDLLNEIAYQVRPYEIEPGSTDRALEKCLALCAQTLHDKDYGEAKPGLLSRLLAPLAPGKSADNAAMLLDAAFGDRHVRMFEECARLIDEEVEVDYTQPKPIVKITGEFWAQTTEGDGNFRMFEFLEREGAEVHVEPVATWLMYLLLLAREQAADRRGLDESREAPPSWWRILPRLRLEGRYWKSVTSISIAEKLLHRVFEAYRRAFGGTAHQLLDQDTLKELAHPYYHSRSTGGEGHLEVAKNIYACTHDLAHMVLSLKPFGCMPSTQSDGAQAAVVAHFTDMVFLPLETSGEGDVNAHSRAQMALGEAKMKCRDEFQRALTETGADLDDIRAFVAKHRELRRPLQMLPRRKGVVGRAARFLSKSASLRRQALKG